MKKNLRRYFLILLISLLFPLFLQAAKPDAALKPVSVLGEISESQEVMIYNQLQSQLSQNYKLVPKSVYEKAMEKVAEEMESDQCTPEHCVRAIQDILQVDRLFTVMIIEDDSITQLTLELVRKEGKLVKSDTCKNCGIETLLSKIKTLTAAIMADDLGVGAVRSTGVQFATPKTGGASGTGGVQIAAPTVSGDTQSDIAALSFDSDPSGATVYLGDMESGVTPFYDDTLKANQQVLLTIKKTDYHD
ncbi:hypothetical protein KKA14_11345, partial [bacterium]|nr:hypothetical protein [bacterium]